MNNVAKDLTKGGYPTLAAATKALNERESDSKLEIRRLEMSFLASGECTYRITPTGEGEPLGGVISLRDGS